MSFNYFLKRYYFNKNSRRKIKASFNLIAGEIQPKDDVKDGLNLLMIIFPIFTN